MGHAGFKATVITFKVHSKVVEAFDTGSGFDLGRGGWADECGAASKWFVDPKIKDLIRF